MENININSIATEHYNNVVVRCRYGMNRIVCWAGLDRNPTKVKCFADAMMIWL